MLPKYTFALGGTDKIKQFLDYINQAEQTIDVLKNKFKDKEHLI